MAAKKGIQAPASLVRMGAEHRAKIQNSNILNALIEHACGEREMNPSQVTAGLGLLRKVMPDLSASENKNETTVRYVARASMPAKTVDEWLTRVKKPNGNGATTTPIPKLQ